MQREPAYAPPLTPEPGYAPSPKPEPAFAPPPKPVPAFVPPIADAVKAKITGPIAALTSKIRSAQPGRNDGAVDRASPAPAPAKTTSTPQRTGGTQVARKRPAQDQAQPRGARVVLTRVEPWSIMKFSFMVSLVAWIVLFVAVAVLYYLLKGLGVFHHIEQTIGLITTSKGSPGSNAASLFSASTILGYTALAGAIDVILITALATVGSVVYNLITKLTGGVELVMSEAD